MGKDTAGRVSPRVTTLPRLYAILDAGVLDRQKMEIGQAAEQLRDAGVTLLQYRDKAGTREQILRNATIIGGIFSGVDCTLVLNDDPALAVILGWNAVHVGQGDVAVGEARKVLLQGGLVGCSTHNDEQVVVADAAGADYVAIGPVFATGTKADAEPVVGLEGVRRARALTQRSLVAIGGITPANASSVIEAGADSVAVVGALLASPDTVRDAVQRFRAILGDR
ncbi:MAG TPA: thiamine phosphate synthase [Edaphobacter sp.]|nr:thiamine phosphate synthase [Edaphobacter sp.]